jgi:hypothetical protein
VVVLHERVRAQRRDRIPIALGDAAYESRHAGPTPWVDRRLPRLVEFVELAVGGVEVVEVEAIARDDVTLLVRPDHEQ